MKLYLNHTERYPVEQLQMQLFASEPSEFVTAPFAKGENGAVSNLFTGNTYVTATAKIIWNGKTGRAAKRLPREKADVRHTRRILQQSYYLAAMQVLDAVPPWGALSGVRPSKLSTKALLAGKTRRQAERELEREFFVTPERAKLCVDASEHTVEAMNLLAPRDLSVYIGIPFCPTRCAYCSFVSESVERFGEFLPPYLDCLLREVEYTGKLLRQSGWHVRTLYMGGGTPTTLSAEQMARLLEAVNTHFDLSRCLEFTVEGGRPDTLDAEKLRVIKAGGATRISINPQTMSDTRVKGRRAAAQRGVRRGRVPPGARGRASTISTWISSRACPPTRRTASPTRCVRSWPSGRATSRYTRWRSKRARICSSGVLCCRVRRTWPEMLEDAERAAPRGRLCALLSLPAEVHVRQL